MKKKYDFLLRRQQKFKRKKIPRPHWEASEPAKQKPEEGEFAATPAEAAEADRTQPLHCSDVPHPLLSHLKKECHNELEPHLQSCVSLLWVSCLLCTAY